MAKKEDRYELKMHFELVKAGETSPMWVHDNNYPNMDYGDIVLTQAVVTDALGKGLMAIGIAEAAKLGFDVMGSLEAIKQVGEPKGQAV